MKRKRLTAMDHPDIDSSCGPCEEPELQQQKQKVRVKDEQLDAKVVEKAAEAVFPVLFSNAVDPWPEMPPATQKFCSRVARAVLDCLINDGWRKK